MSHILARIPLQPNTIRRTIGAYDIFPCAQKLTIWSAYSARHRNRKLKKTKNKIRVAQEETVWAKVREGSPGGRSETTGVGFVNRKSYVAIIVL